MAYKLMVGPTTMSCKLIDTVTGAEVQGIASIEIPKMLPGNLVKVIVELNAVEIEVTALGENVCTFVKGREHYDLAKSA